MRILGAVLLFSCVIAAADAAADAPCNAQCIATLAEHGAWLELSLRLDEVPVEKRDRAWELLIERAAVGIVDTLAKKQETFGGAMIAESLLRRHPSLRTSKAFKDARENLHRIAHGS